MKTAFYQITCLTELHMGSGESNFHVIDKTVERDPVTQYPIMNASGVKGALLEFFRRAGNPNTVTLFGAAAEPKKTAKDGTTTEATNSKPGNLRILSAKLLGRAVRASSGNGAYYIATTLSALKEYNVLSSLLTGKAPLDIPAELSAEQDYFYAPGDQDEIGVEETIVNQKLSDPFAKQLMDLLYATTAERPGVAILNDKCFRGIALPVSARNHLIDKISDNLWYEENVPNRSSFWFAVQGSEEHLKSFEEGLGEQPIVQFGGDASVGKGLCLLRKLEV